jgi:hypothetical protein
MQTTACHTLIRGLATACPFLRPGLPEPRVVHRRAVCVQRGRLKEGVEGCRMIPVPSTGCGDVFDAKS